MRLMTGKFFLPLWLGLSVVVHAGEELVIQRKERTISARVRQQMQDSLAELYERYAHALIEELQLLGSLLEEALQTEVDSVVCQRRDSLVAERMKQLESAIIFVKTGRSSRNETELVVPHATLYLQRLSQSVQQVASLQAALLQVIRALLERDMSSCFVAARTKKVLEHYQSVVKGLITDSKVYVQKIAECKKEDDR